MTSTFSGPSEATAVESPEERLVSLVYVSSAVKDFNEEEIVEILRVARVKNQRQTITGMLLYKDGNFMQALEGPESTVGSLINTIEQDPRHRGVIVLAKRPLQGRQFPSWSMAFHNLNTLAPEDAAAYSPFLTHSLMDDHFRMHPHRCYRLLMHFKNSVK